MNYPELRSEIGWKLLKSQCRGRGREEGSEGRNADMVAASIGVKGLSDVVVFEKSLSVLNLDWIAQVTIFFKVRGGRC